LDVLPPSPNTALLSAQEASERLREIVEGFFFRQLRTEDGKRIRRLLVKSPRDWVRRGPDQTHCWREMDSNFRFRCVRRS